jgi:hypothetical protein
MSADTLIALLNGVVSVANGNVIPKVLDTIEDKMTNYGRYKQWWIKHEAPHNIPSLYYGDTPESAFRQHIGDMSLYKLMETLEDWSE